MSMEILDNGTTPLANHEVLTILRHKKNKWVKQGRITLVPPKEGDAPAPEQERDDTALEQIQPEQILKYSVPTNVMFITNQVESGLTRTGAALHPGPDGKQAAKYNNDCYMELARRLMKYRLPTGEMIQLFNLRPSTLVELEAIIIENEKRARFKTKYLKDILRHVQEVLGPDEP